MNINKHTLLIFICWILIAHLAVADIETVDDAVALIADKADDKSEAIQFLLENSCKALPALREYFFPDFNRLLKQLGDEKFTNRRFATKMLIRDGFPLSRQREIIALKNLSNDPEVKCRCGIIIKALSQLKKMPFKQGFDAALEVVLKSGVNDEDTLCFLRYFYENYERCDKRMLPLVLRKTVKWKILVPYIVSLLEKSSNEKETRILEDSLKTIVPNEFKRLLLEISISRLVPKYQKILDEEAPFRSHDYFKIIDRMMVEDANFKKFPLMYAEKFLQFNFKVPSSDPDIVQTPKGDVRTLSTANVESLIRLPTLGVCLYVRKGVDLPKKFKKTIFSIVRISPENSAQTLMLALNQIKNNAELFKDDFLPFLQADSRSSVLYGLDFAAMDPVKHENEILKVVLRHKGDMTELFSGLSYLVSFVKSNYPEDRDRICSIFIDAIQSERNPARVCQYARFLSEWGYSGCDLKEWWERRMADPRFNSDSNHKFLMDTAEYLGIVSPLYVKNLNNGISLNSSLIEYSLKYSDPLQSEFITWALSRMEHPRYNSFYYPEEQVFLKEKPAMLPQLLSTFFQRKENSEIDSTEEFECGYEKEFKIFTKALRKNLDKISLVTPYSLNGNPFVRFYAAGLLARLNQNPEKQANILIQLLKEMPQNFHKAILANILLAKPPLPVLLKKLDDMKFRFEKAKKFIYFLPFVYERTSHRQELIGFLKKQMNNKNDLTKVIAAHGLLFINELDDETMKFFRKIVAESEDSQAFWFSFESLCLIDQEPDVCLERLEKFILKDSGNAFDILRFAPKNAKKAYPFLLDNIYRLDCFFNNIDFSGMLAAYPSLKKKVVPQLISKAEKAVPDNINTFLDVLSKNMCYYPGCVESLKKIRPKIQSRFSLKYYLVILAKLGPEAAKFSFPYARRFSRQTGYLRLLYYLIHAKAEPEKAKRREFTEKLVRYSKKYFLKPFNSEIPEIIGVVTEFPEITQPYLLRSWRVENSFSTLEELSRIRPFTKDVDLLFRRILTDSYSYDESSLVLLMDLCRRFPEECEPYLELIENLPLDMQINSGCVNAIFELRRHRSKPMRSPSSKRTHH